MTLAMQVPAIVVVTCATAVNFAWADPTKEDIEQVFGHNERTVNIATGYAKPVAVAPAVTTVVTAQDIEAIGAKTLDQVLETVPGIHVSTARGIIPIASMRGISSELNPGTLVMINGIPVAQTFTNNFTPFYALPTNNIARVEIIRGPGSALYGADAFAGVINVVTKTAEGLRRSELGGRAGEFDSYEGWLLHGMRIGGADIAVGLTGQTTDGHTGIIEADAQTALDRIFGTSASLAPGRINMDRDIIMSGSSLATGASQEVCGLMATRTPVSRPIQGRPSSGMRPLRLQRSCSMGAPFAHRRFSNNSAATTYSRSAIRISTRRKSIRSNSR